MKFFPIAAAAALYAATVSSTKVACRINGVQDSVVDLETGSCEFEIPSTLPVTFTFSGLDNYEVDAYYAIVDSVKKFNDIAHAGRTILIPARVLFEQGNFPLYHIHAEKKNSLNSTQALHARFNQVLEKRDAISDLIAEIMDMPGEETKAVSLKVTVPDAPTVSEPSSDSAASAPAPASPLSTETVTNTKTSLITVTSCSDHKCSETIVPATKGPTTVTTDGTTTVYTTWCPVTAAGTVATTTVTITHCSNNKCSETIVPATEGPTTVTSAGTTTVYNTWYPVTPAGTVATTTVTLTHCSNNKCSETIVPATEGPTTITTAGTTTVYNTWYPVTTTSTQSVPTVGTPATTLVKSVSPVTTNTSPNVASESTTQSHTPVVEIKNAGYKVGASLFMLALPLAYIF